VILGGVELVGDDGPARDVVVSASRIARVTEACAADRSRDGPRVELPGALVFPGLINSHDHLEFNLYPPLGHAHYGDYVEWGEDIHRRDRDLIARIERVPRRDRLRWGALKNLLCGVTTVAQHGDAPGDVRGLNVGIPRATWIHSVRQGRRWRWKLNTLVDGSPYVVHVGEGTSLGARREIDQLLRWNLFRRPLVAVHAIAMRADQAARFRAVVWCPVSNEFLYGVTADVASLAPRTMVLFGTDSTLSADWNLWSHLRHARALAVLDDRALFDAVTQTAARAWERPDIGAIRAGLTADVVVAKKKGHAAATNRWDGFFAVEPEDILLVLRGGAVVLADASVDLPFPAGPSSVLRIGGREKRVAEDVPDLLARIEACGVESNLPIAPGTLLSSDGDPSME
jgi:cytosine/adenosine deaminase-related metal-dependent hydrolase